MLLGAGVSKGFWGEAAETACYLITKCPSIALNFKTPQEIWIGKAPSLNHLKVFGCSAYAHIRQDKPQPRAKKIIFLGYLEGVKRYKPWCTYEGSKKVIISIGVTFNELEMPLLKKETHNLVTNTKEPDIEVLSQEIENKRSS